MFLDDCCLWTWVISWLSENLRAQILSELHRQHSTHYLLLLSGSAHRPPASWCCCLLCEWLAFPAWMPIWLFSLALILNYLTRMCFSGTERALSSCALRSSLGRQFYFLLLAAPFTQSLSTGTTIAYVPEFFGRSWISTYFFLSVLHFI